VQSDLADRFRAEVVERGEFEHDWFTVHIPVWETRLSELEGRNTRILELGSFEGMSACFLLWRFPGAHVTCIDSFEYFSDPELEGRFDRNVALVDASRVRKFAGRTHSVLPRLVEAAETFDFVYVDGSHRALDVLVDAALCWQLLATEGILLFDDYGLVREDPLEAPGIAIDAFQRVVADRSERLPMGRQFALRRKA
jgi:predicted O-methyltransferase YrrM